MWKASEGATRDSPLRTRRRESIWAAGQEERLARVRLTTLAPWRRLWRRRMAGGELRLGTDSIYMGKAYYTNTNKNKRKLLYTWVHKEERAQGQTATNCWR